MASSRPNEKKSRTSLSLEEKLHMIRLSESGMSNTEIGRRLGIVRQTVSQVIMSKEKFLKEVRNATPTNTKRIRQRCSLIADMEKILTVWIEDQTSRNIPLSQDIIQFKALALFNTMKAKRGQEASEEKFEASRGWFMRFKERSQLRNVRVKGEAASADAGAAAAYPSELGDIIDEGGYTSQQIFNIDETGLYWKKMPSRSFIAKEERSMPGFKVSKERLTLLLGANAAGDFKLKPMLIYRSENPRALKNYTKSTLPVLYRWNQAAWMTAHLFTSWFTDYFKPTVEAYCAENKIPFKILLTMDNAPCHPRAVAGMYKEINVVFLPANTSCLLQPMDQGVISTFKSYYLRNTLRMAITAIDKDTSERDGKNKLKDFWKGYSILDAIKNNCDSWEEISRGTLTGAWNALTPSLPHNWEGTEASLKEVTEDVISMARELELEVEQEDVTEMLQSHDKPLTDEELFLIDEQRRSFREVEHIRHTVDAHQAEMTTKDLQRYIELVDEAAAGFERIDPNFERSSTVSKMLSSSISCYKEIHRERKRRSLQQVSLLRYLSNLPQLSQSSSIRADDIEQPSTSKQGPVLRKLPRLLDSSDSE
ncbi:hypothetical protein M514_16004, partial [Trichuris suis]